MSLIVIFTSIMLGLMFVGLVLGMIRGWKKSLIRTGILLVGLIVALLITPSLTAGFIEKNVSGSTIKIFSQTINFEKLLTENISGEFITEIFADNSVTNELIISIINVVVNVALFFVIFFIIEIFSLLIYWIVLIVIKVKTRHDEKEYVPKDGKFWGLRVLAGFIGMIGSLIITFAIMTPVYGVINICDGFLEESKTENVSTVAVSNPKICGKLYYIEDKNIGKIEGYIQSYADIRESYDKSFVGKFSNFFGMSKLGGLAFERLTTVKNGGLTLNLTEEFVQVIKTYNLYKEVFIEQKFEFENNEHIDELINLYDEAMKSEVLKEYVVEFIPKMSDKWSSGETFLGIENPVQGDWSEVVNSALIVFKVDNINRISNNVKALANALKVANNNDIINKANGGAKPEDIIFENDNFVKDEIIVLTSTVELRENISKILNEAFEVLYKEVIGEEKEFKDNSLSNEEIANLNLTNGWVKEAENIQNAINEIFDIYKITKEDSSEDALINKLENIGAAIDYARESSLISKPFKVFVTDFIKIKTNLKQSIKNELLLNIEEKWDNSEVKFAKTFKAIQESALIAKDMAEGKENVSLDNLSGTLKEIVDDTATKDMIADILEKDLVSDVAGEGNQDTAGVMTDMLETFVTSDKVNSGTIDDDIVAGNQILDIVDSVKNNGGDLGLGETEQEKQAAADQIVSNLTGSAGMMELIKNSTEAESSAITSFTENVKPEDKSVLEQSINGAEISTEEKNALKALFGIN